MAKKEQSIHPFVLIIIGIVIGVSSIFVNISSESNFVLFIFAGFLMAGYGGIKFIIYSKSSEKNEKKDNIHHAKENTHQPHQQVENSRNNHNLPNHARQHHQSSSNHRTFCPNCGGRLPGHVNFCPHCGLRFN